MSAIRPAPTIATCGGTTTRLAKRPPITGAVEPRGHCPILRPWFRSVDVPPASSNPCLPSKVAEPPSGLLWVHEIKHDGYRLMVRRDGQRVRCFTRNGQ